jgi:hypothetical protein
MSTVLRQLLQYPFLEEFVQFLVDMLVLATLRIL